MGTFDSASVQDHKRLLELFPIGDLRRFWPQLKGTKEEVCQQAAETKDLDRIAEFVDEHFGCCKQHVYIFRKPEEVITPPATLGGESPVRLVGDALALYVLRTTYEVVLREPLEETSIDFLWPIRVEISPDGPYVTLRFVVLEKTVSAYFDRPCYVPDRSVEEKAIVKEVEQWAAERADLHKGIKELWKNKFMDSPSAKQKKALSMAQEIMDEDLGIRENNPELFAELQENALLSALFLISDKNCGADVFSAKPSEGYLAFPRYSGKGGDGFCYFRDSSKQSVICCPIGFSWATRKRCRS
jgi:hypothetical protein